MDAKMIFDFGIPGELDAWYVLNDTVMGGRSQSRIVAAAEGTVAFAGVVSLENYGGFASVRTTPQARDLGA